MFRLHPQRLDELRQVLSGISLRGPGAAIAFISFVGGAALSLPLAILLDNSRYYGASEIALFLPVALALGVAVVLGARGRRKIMIDVLAALVGLCVLTGIAVGASSLFGG
ncbi:hypothetical protein [Paraburkholderia adhaesiva]|uniref:hypothetical protein n=1 Tax=Paraburkholderia adhaesiva TaxID=2883244 RepID=UPI001F2BAFD2|nr:hypothetical protein [Paraburkholderia adhaesiva]